MRGVPARFVDFHKGVNTKAAPYQVDSKEARDVRNFVSTTRGALKKRNGCQNFSAPAAELLSLIPSEATASKVLIGTHATDIFTIDSGGTDVLANTTNRLSDRCVCVT